VPACCAATRSPHASRSLRPCQTGRVSKPQHAIRPAVADDLEAIFRADPSAVGGDTDRAELLRLSVDLGECQLYVDDDGLAGLMVLTPAHFFGRDFIELLRVVPERRRSGVGRALLRAALAGPGTARLFTSTNQSNQPMRSLLAAEGWSLSGELDGLDDGDPELVFYRDRPAISGGPEG
jgi:GNAT superfamily N-acetyltransferase